MRLSRLGLRSCGSKDATHVHLFFRQCMALTPCRNFGNGISQIHGSCVRLTALRFTCTGCSRGKQRTRKCPLRARRFSAGPRRSPASGATASWAAANVESLFYVAHVLRRKPRSVPISTCARRRRGCDALRRPAPVQFMASGVRAFVRTGMLVFLAHATRCRMTCRSAARAAQQVPQKAAALALSSRTLDASIWFALRSRRRFEYVSQQNAVATQNT